VLSKSNGDLYEGQWKYDRINGRGIYNYANGEKYDGEWQNNIRNGKGTLKE